MQRKIGHVNDYAGKACHGLWNTKGGSIIVPLTSCLTGLDQSVLHIKTKNVSCHATNSKPVKQEVNSTVILPPLVFPAGTYTKHRRYSSQYQLFGVNETKQDK